MTNPIPQDYDELIEFLIKGQEGQDKEQLLENQKRNWNFKDNQEWLKLRYELWKQQMNKPLIDNISVEEQELLRFVQNELARV